MTLKIGETRNCSWRPVAWPIKKKTNKIEKQQNAHTNPEKRLDGRVSYLSSNYTIYV